MKWFSVKNYEPPGDCDLLVFCSFYCWDRLSVARYMYENGSGNFYKIDMDVNGRVKNRSSVDVTHFCIPDPIEIEDEE